MTKRDTKFYYIGECRERLKRFFFTLKYSSQLPQDNGGLYFDYRLCTLSLTYIYRRRVKGSGILVNVLMVGSYV